MNKILLTALLLVSSLVNAEADTKGSDKISAQEKAIRASFDKIDTDNNAVISWSEYHASVRRARAQVAQNRRAATLRNRFNTLDRNRNGSLEPGEVASMALAKKSGAAELMKSVDANRDKKVSLDEYLAHINKLTVSK